MGLDTPASCIAILNALKAAGYGISSIPKDGNALIAQLTCGVTNDPESQFIRLINQSLTLEPFANFFSSLDSSLQQAITERWGEGHDNRWGDRIPIPGIELGNVFVGIQPSRGYERDPSLNYHAPDLEPTPDYLAYYHWLRTEFKAQAIIHLGKHGNLEWLPGKSIALSHRCYPEVALGPIPNFYPFIVNDPGEGSQAKRRAHAVILDHLTPPLTRAELYGDLIKLEGLIDEYYEAQTLDPTRLRAIGDRIQQLVAETQLNHDLAIQPDHLEDLSQLLTRVDGYLCELKEAQIRDGLHIYGHCPQGKQLIDLIAAIARSPSFNRLGLTRAIAQDLDLDFDPLTCELGEPFSLGRPSQIPQSFLDLYENLERSRIKGDAVSCLEEQAIQLIQQLIDAPFASCRSTLGKATNKELHWIEKTLLPNLRKTPQEIENLLQGLAGKYVSSGAAGAPTRGRPEVLPTGRNFYSVDIRAIPTETAWDVGRKAAEALIERYTQDHGEYPKTIALSIWGTSTMRTGGDDIAQVMALMGARPIWDGPSRPSRGF